MAEAGVIVANHSSWLDIFALNSGGPLFFVSKSEVSNWPIIGPLARFSGTVFISRDRRNAQIQKNVFEDRLRAGHKLLFFPEGTSSDGQRVLKFKPTLFAALFSPDLPGLFVQPVSVVYHTVEGQDARHYGWWGDMAFMGHFLRLLTLPSIHAELTFGDAIPAGDDRKKAAQRSHQEIERAFAPVSQEEPRTSTV